MSFSICGLHKLQLKMYIKYSYVENPFERSYTQVIDAVGGPDLWISNNQINTHIDAETRIFLYRQNLRLSEKVRFLMEMLSITFVATAT